MVNYIQAVGNLQGYQLVSTASNVSPIITSSSQIVNNLNSQYLNGQPDNFYTNINNINQGVLSVKYGGTGISSISPGQVLFGSSNSQNLICSSNLFYDTNNNLLSTPQLNITLNTNSTQSPIVINNSNMVSNLNAQYLGGKPASFFASSQLCYVCNGGTGLSNISNGYILFGCNSQQLNTTSNLYWDNINLFFRVNGNIISSNQLISVVVPGIAPLSVASTTMVSNLNVQYLNGQLGSFYTNANNISSGVLQTPMGGTGLSSPLQGQILFGQQSGSIGQSSNLMWNSSQNFLGINNQNPSNALDIVGNVNIQGSVTIKNTLIMSNSQTINQGQIIFGGQSNLTTQSSNLYYNSNLNCFGIGTANPSYPLHINSSVIPNLSNYGYFTSNAQYGTNTQGSQTGAYSILCSGRIACNQEIDILSDYRLKENIVNIDLQKEIQFITNINPVLFNRKNSQEKTQSYGFIAQDVCKLDHSNLVGQIPNQDLEEYIDQDNFISPQNQSFVLNYEGFIPIHTKIIQFLLNQNQVFLKKIQILEQKYENIDICKT